MRSLLQIILFSVLLATFSVKAQEALLFENGTVAAPAYKGEQHCYPVLARTSTGNLFVAWAHFQKNKDSKILGAVSTDNGRTWGKPFKVLESKGMSESDPAIIIDGDRILVYSSSVKRPNKITNTDTLLAESRDEGKTWSKPLKLAIPFNYLVGKRHLGLKLQDGTLVLPASYDIWAQKGGIPAKSEGEMDLKSGVLLSKDGINWTPYLDIHLLAQKVSPFGTNGVVEPAAVELENREILLLLRTGTSNLYESRSADGGKTWTQPSKSALTSHNTPASLWRLDKGSNEIIVIWNNHPLERDNLSVAISADGGRNWSKPKTVASKDGRPKNYHDLQVSYPGITQDREGNFVAVWQKQLPNGDGREIRWARFNRAWVLAQ
ncbi:MAG: sialidase family protein [Pyrinomonadaceae bacterium]